LFEEIIQKLKTEMKEYETELNVKLPKEIQKAREYGDLRENAEYKAALERQGFVRAKLEEINQRLNDILSIDISKIPTDRAAYGSTLVVYDLEKEEKVTYKLVTSEESDPEKGLISTVSPIGQSFMGKKEGDEVKVKTPRHGVRTFEIVELTTIHGQ
jgi:transcription elongation factor GreA